MADFVRRYLRLADRFGDDRDLGPEALRAATQELQQEFADLLATTMTVPDEAGHVEISLDLGGRLSNVYVSPYAMRDLDAPALGEAVTAAIRRARTQVGERLAQELGDLPEEYAGQDPVEMLQRRFG